MLTQKHRREGAALGPPDVDLVEDAGRSSWTKSGTEGSGRGAEGIRAWLLGIGGCYALSSEIVKFL